MRNKDKKHTNL